MSRKKQQIQWNPPVRLLRQAALGTVADRDQVLCAACCSCSGDCSDSRPGCFQSKTPPKPSDWLASGMPGECERIGQSFPQYVKGKNRERRRKFPLTQKRTIYLCNIDGSENENAATAMEILRKFVETFFCVPCKLLDALSPQEAKKLSTSGRYDPLWQLCTGPIHGVLRRRKGPLKDAFVVMGVTMDDLYPCTKWSFVLGEANPEKGVGVFSFARFMPEFHERWMAAFDADANQKEIHKRIPWPQLADDSGLIEARSLFLRRILSIIAHEIAHLFHLEHCVYYQCVMNGANNLDEQDDSPTFLCPVCLKKLHYALRKAGVKFNPIERYNMLSDILEDFGLHEEADWARGAASRCNSYLQEGAMCTVDESTEEEEEEIPRSCRSREGPNQFEMLAEGI